MFKKEASRQSEIFQDSFSGIRTPDKQFVKNTRNMSEAATGGALQKSYS